MEKELKKFDVAQLAHVEILLQIQMAHYGSLKNY